MQHNPRGLAFCYVAIFLLSINGLFSKLIPLDAVSITQLRSVIAALALLGFCLLTRRRLRLYSPKDTALVYGVGALMGLHWVTYFHAMQISSIAIGMVSVYTFPLITVMLEPYFSRRRIQRGDIIAAVIVLLGIGVMAYEQMGTVNTDMLLGIVWGVLSALFFSLRNLVQKYHLAHISSDSLMLHQLLAISFLLALFIDYPGTLSLSNNDIALLVCLGVICTASAHTLLIAAMKMLPVKTVAMLGCMTPMLGALTGWLVLDEKLTSYIAVGGITIIAVALYESMQAGKSISSSA